MEALDLLDTIEESLRKRRFGTVVRLMVHKTMPDYIKNFLAENMRVEMQDIYALTGPLDLTCLMQITKIERHDLKDPPFTPSSAAGLRMRSTWMTARSSASSARAISCSTIPTTPSRR
jgi:polyphosphate kinase